MLYSCLAVALAMSKVQSSPLIFTEGLHLFRASQICNHICEVAVFNSALLNIFTITELSSSNLRVGSIYACLKLFISYPDFAN